MPGPPRSTATIAAFAVQLNRRARDRTVGAVDAAITRFGLEHRVTLLALVKPLAGVGRHRLNLDVTAHGAGQCRLHDHRGHFALAAPGGVVHFVQRFRVHGVSLLPYRSTESNGMKTPVENQTIGALADAAGVNVETIRFYQRKRLIP